MANYFVGVDVGGQSIKGGVVDDTGQALSSVSVPTEAFKGQEHGLGQMCETVRRAIADAHLQMADVSAIGIATPGTMDIPAGIILDPPNLRPWKNVPVRKHLEDTFDKPTAFQNDANAAAYGEYWAGAGRHSRSMVLFTLGTGIGCGIIINDAILEGEHSHGAEVGHTIVEMTTGRMCGCGQRGHLEAYASATAVVRRAEEALNQDGGMSILHQNYSSPRHLPLFPQGRADGSEKQLSARDVFEAAHQGDGLAKTIVEETAYYLAVGAVNMMHTINPDMVVFGGGMIAAGESFLDSIRHHVKRMAFPVPAEKTRICYAELGNDAGFIGAAACGRQLFRRKPSSLG
jgi:glucokinase